MLLLLTKAIVQTGRLSQPWKPHLTCSWIDWCVFSLLNTQSTLDVSLLLSLRSLSGKLTRIHPALPEGSPNSVRLIQAFFLCSTHHLLSGPYKSLLTSLPLIPAPPNSISSYASALGILLDSLFPDHINPLHKTLQQLLSAWFITLSSRIIIMKLILTVIHFWVLAMCQARC